MSHQLAKPFGLSRAGRVVRWITSLMLVINVLQPFAAAAREPLDQQSVAAPQPTGQPAAAEPATVALAPAAPQAVNIVATKRDRFLNDVENDALADPGDTIEYTLIVTNTGDTDASGVSINDTIDGNTTLVAGTVRVSPLARDDAYTAVGNTLLAVGAAVVPNVPTAFVAGSLFDNDSEFLGDTFTLQSFQAASAQGGTVAVNPNGSFTYLPPAGFTGSDTFTYTITDGDMTAVGTVTITVANRVWYVDTAAAAGGTGRSNSPFNTVTPLNGAGGAGDVDAINDIIFFNTGAANYTALILEDDQQLIGRGVDLVVGGSTLLAAGTAPTMGGAGTLVTLAQNNTVRGLTITSQTSGMGIAGTNFGTATINATTLNGGPALALTTGALTASFPTLSSSGGSTGVSLIGVTGSLSVTAGALTGISGTDIAIDGGTIAVTYPGTITNTGGRSIEILNHATGAIAFSGAINDTGTGMLLQGNTSGTITFSSTTMTYNTGANPAITLISNSGTAINFTGGNLSVTTSTGTGMNITGGGTVQVTGTNGTINSSGGKALNMVATTSGGMSFRSISASVSAGVGVTLNGIGAGGFTVLGSGTTNGSGGVIQNTNRGYEIISAQNISLSNIQLNNAAQNNAASGCNSSDNTGCNAAIFLSSATAVGLTNVDITSVNQIGINGATVNGFTLNNSTILNCGNEGNEGCLRFSNLSGTSAINNSDIALNPTAGFNGERAVWIDNTSGTLTLNVTSSIFRDTFNSSLGADGFELDVGGTAIATLNVSGSDFLRNGTLGLQVLTADTATANVRVSTSDFDYDTAAFGRGIELNGTQSSTMNFDISNNPTIKGKGGVGLAIVMDNNTRGNGFIRNNAYIAGTPGSTGSALMVRANGTAQIKVEISGNTVDKQGSDNGITIENPTTGGTSRIDAVVTGNNVTTTTQAAYGIQLLALTSNTICGYVANNAVTELSTSGGLLAVGAFRARASTAGAVIILENFTADTATTWINNGNTPANAARVGGSGAGTIMGGTCARPIAFRPAAADAAPTQPAAESVATQPVAAPAVAVVAAERTQDATSSRPAAPTDGAQALAPTSGETVSVNVGTLPAGKRLIIIFEVEVNTPLSVPTATNIANQATISGGNFATVLSNDPDTVAASDPTLTPIDRRSSLSLSKSDGGISAAPGDTINYTLTITNAITRPAASTVLTETVPVNTTFNAGASSPGWVCAPTINAGSICTLAVGNVDGNSTTTRSFAVSVISPVPAGVTSVSNTATVGDTQSTSELTPANNSASDTTPINATPDLRITKSDGGITAAPLDVIGYTLAITNTGNQGASGVRITETVPLHTTFNAAGSSAGWSCANGAPAGTVCTLNIASLSGGGAATTRTFAVTVVDPLPGGVNSTTNTASVADDGANGSEPTPGNNSASDTTPLSAEPNLGLTKSDSGITTTPGGVIPYRLEYTNSGTRAAAGVVITETVPLHTTFNAGASTGVWSCANNSPAGTICTTAVGTVPGRGGNGVYIFAVTVVPAVPTGVTQISNTATITDDGTGGIDPDPSNNTASDTTPLTAQPDLVIVKSDGGASVAPGGTVAYTLSYTNTGNQAATGVVLSETVPANTTFNAGASTAGWVCAPNNNPGATCTLAVGSLNSAANGSATFALTVVNVAPPGVNQISNTATVANDNANGADPTPANNTSSDTTPLDAAPDLSITKSDGGSTTTPGGTVAYTLSITNTGNQGATGVRITETVPLETTFNAGASSAGWSCANGSPAGTICNLNVGNLAGGGASSPRTFAVTVVSPVAAGLTQISNTASVADNGSNGADPTPGNNSGSDTTPLTAAPVLSLSKSDGGVSVAPGGTVAYTLAYTNTGNQGATGVVLSETVPANTTFNAGASTAGWICAPDSNAGSTCTLNVGGLVAGGSGSATFAVIVVNPVAAGIEQISNTATISDDGANSITPATASASDTTPVNAAPDLTITKSDGGITAVPGQTIVYTLTVANSGNQGTSGVGITETVPLNTTFNAAASSAGWTCTPNNTAGSICTLSVGALATTGSATRIFAVTVNSPVAAGVTSIENTASVGDSGTSGPDANPANNTDSESTPLAAAPALALAKSDGGVSVAPGATINYTLSFSNTGNQAATGITLSETVPANTTFNATASTAGWSCADDSPSGSVCTFTSGSLSGGASGSAVFAVTVDLPVPGGTTSIENTASITDDGTNSAEPATAEASDTTPLNLTLDLSVTKTVTPAVANPGDPITYTIRFASSGNTIASGVVISDTLPSEVTITGITNSGAAISQTSPAPNLAWSTKTLVPGESGIITLTGTVNLGLIGEQTITNTVIIATGQETAPANNTASAVFSINLAPTANAGGPYTVDEGSTVQLSAAASTDPGNDPLTFAWDLDNNGSYETAGATATFTNTPDDAVSTVGLQVTDSDGAVATTTTTVTVENVAPAVNAGADRAAEPNEVISFTGVFTDPGVLDTHTIAWDFGDGGSNTTILTPSHAYTLPGTYTVTLTVTDDDGGVGVDTLLVNVRNTKVYLPMILQAPTYPDLVVQNVTTTGTSISVVIRNQGAAPVTEQLWIDLYLNPNPAPTAVNQVWEILAPHGMVWGLTNAALPLQPGQSLTLTTNDQYFRRNLSSIPSTISANTRIFVQVDSANSDTTYGAVLESHEQINAAYNNIFGPLLTSQPITIPAGARPDAPAAQPDTDMPVRPTVAR